MNAKKKRILCICLGNTCRSVIAEYLIKWKYAEFFEVESAGIFARGENYSKHSIQIVKEKYGMDISEKKSMHIRERNMDEYDLLISLDKLVSDELLSLGIKPEKILKMEVDDPFQKDYPAYEMTAEKIDLLIAEFLLNA